MQQRYTRLNQNLHVLESFLNISSVNILSESQFNELIHAPEGLKICAFLGSVKGAEFKVLAEAITLKGSFLSAPKKLLIGI